MIPVEIIGFGLGFDDLAPKHIRIIKGADILIGGKRHLAAFQDHPSEKKEITGKIDKLADFIRKNITHKKIVVMASGDPLFFGIGATLITALGPDNIKIHPNISSIAAAFSRIKEPWDDVRVISLHGNRLLSPLFKALEENSRVAVFTDANKTPSWLASKLVEKGIQNFHMCVLENLGTDDESISWHTLGQAAVKSFSSLNVVILKKYPSESRADATSFLKDFYLGAEDDLFEHEAGLITKSEIRAVTLSKLRLWPGLVFWDLGAGSGSIAIEASLLLGDGKIIAVEQKQERIKLIEQNKKHFNVNNLFIVKAVMPDGLNDLPLPDRIFIGGGGKELGLIIERAAARLKKNGVIVVNTVLFNSLETARMTLGKLDFKIEVAQIQVSKSKPMPHDARFIALNPVWIITGYK